MDLPEIRSYYLQSYFPNYYIVSSSILEVRKFNEENIPQSASVAYENF